MDNIRTQLKPQGIIAYYKSDSGSQYAEIYPIEDGKRLPARPIGIDDLKELSRSVNSDGKKHIYRCKGILAENILLSETNEESYNLCWKNKAQERSIYFDKTFSSFTKLKFIVPPTIYLACGTDLRVFHFIDDKRPTEKTILFECIMPNTMEGGAICFGNIKRNIPKRASYQELIELWENYYWTTKFTATGIDQKELSEFKRLSKSHNSIFDLKLLKKSKFKTLGSLLNTIQ